MVLYLFHTEFLQNYGREKPIQKKSLKTIKKNNNETSAIK